MLFSLGKQAGGFATGTGATRTPHAMRVHLGIASNMVVNHHIQIFNIQPPGGNICCHQHRSAVIGKTHQCTIPRTLVQLAMQSDDIQAVITQNGGQLLGIAAGVAEHHSGIGATVQQQARHSIGAGLIVFHLVKTLIDGASPVLLGNLQQLGVTHHPTGNLLDLLGVSGTEQQALTTGGHLGNNRVKRLLKAHFQHAIGFVQHQGMHLLQLQIALAQVVVHPTRCTDNDMGAVRQ